MRFLFLLISLVFSGNTLSNERVDEAMNLIRSMCLANTQYQIFIEGNGAVSISDGIRGSLTYTTKSNNAVVADVPDEDKQTELESIRDCTSQYINQLLNALLHDGEGWYFSDKNKSCTEECSKHEGLVCNEKSVFEMGRINSRAAFENMNSKGPRVSCSKYADDIHPIAPFQIVSGSLNQCEWRRENNNVQCSATITGNGYDYRRFCYCSQR